MSDSERPDWLDRHLEALPRELEPARDLWPGIARRLPRRGNRHWQVSAMAASVLVAAGLALFAWQTLRVAQWEREATAALLAELIEPYEHIRTAQETRWQAVRAALDPEFAALLQEDMDELRSARSALSNALVTAPADAGLHSLYRQVVTREAELIETGARLATPAI
jgi:hypothetical protein